VKAIVVVTTVGTEEQANLLAEELVMGMCASCVNIVPVHRSVYRWKGKVCEDSEFLLVIKSAEEKYDEVEKTIQELHEYELPEILAFNIARGESGFLEWISDCLSGTPDPEEEVVIERGHEG
jgi:periplasmic divalent cation tolerance protein